MGGDCQLPLYTEFSGTTRTCFVLTSRHRVRGLFLKCLARVCGIEPNMAALPQGLLCAAPLASVRAKVKKKPLTGFSSPVCRIVLLLAPAWITLGCADEVLVPDPAVRYLAFGDSSTRGSSGRAYIDFLPGLLGRPPEEFANQGKGGEATAQGLERLRGLISKGIYPNAHTLLYWEGGGDIVALLRQVDGLLVFSPTAPGYPYATQLGETLDSLQANIEAAITEGQAAGMSVNVATYFFLRETIAPCEPLFLEFILPSQAANANGYILLLNERIRLAATNKGATVVDIASADATLRGDDANFLNCNHLSEKGNAIAADLFAQALDSEAGG